MSVLLPRLEGLGVSQVWLEARTPGLIKRDQKMVDALRSQHAISSWLRVDIGRPLEEPMLWVPDAVCGAIGAARTGNTVWLDLMRQSVEEIEIELR